MATFGLVFSFLTTSFKIQVNFINQVTFYHQSNTSILSSLRGQLLKEMLSLVPSGEKGIKSKNGKSGVEVTVQETVPEHDVSHQDEETLEILQGNFEQRNLCVVREQFFFFKTRATKYFSEYFTPLYTSANQSYAS